SSPTALCSPTGGAIIPRGRRTGHRRKAPDPSRLVALSPSIDSAPASVYPSVILLVHASDPLLRPRASCSSGGEHTSSEGSPPTALTDNERQVLEPHTAHFSARRGPPLCWHAEG